MPKINHSFIAPNSTLVGEVYILENCAIWYNVVIRGDINQVLIASHTSVGDNTVIHTASSLPTGIPASVFIGNHCIIQNNCSIYSCILEDKVFIGYNTVISEGCRIEAGAIVLPNSVVPPGRVIPSNQIWGGNPVRFVRDANESEIFNNYIQTYQQWSLASQHVFEFTIYPYHYLKKESTRDEVDLNPEDLAYSYYHEYQDSDSLRILI